MKTSLNYHFDCSLFEALKLAIEIHGEMGIEPAFVEHNNQKYNFSNEDVVHVLNGDMSPELYAHAHKID
jgi:hypothetical protein